MTGPKIILDCDLGHDDAVSCIIETVRAHGDVWLVPVGPLTNVALAVRQAPDIVERVAGISLMGGALGPSNVTPTAEFNIWADPHAEQIVLAWGAPLVRMAGLNPTHQLCVGPDVIARLRNHRWSSPTDRACPSTYRSDTSKHSAATSRSR